nr:F-box protein SKIP24 [Ipomoea batatas]
MSESELPDELWRRILETGIHLSNLSYRDLCCISITCRRLNRISGEDFLWYSLLSSDFPQPHHNDPSPASTSSKKKSLYKIRYERDRERKRLAHRRAVLRMESEVAEHRRKIQELELQLAEEKEKMKSAVVELSNLRRVRQASVALNVWQPDVIRGRQKQVVEQCNVPVDSRINSTEMELRLCRQQIEGFDKALRVEVRRLEAAKEKLASVKYHPLQDNNLALSSPLGFINEDEYMLPIKDEVLLMHYCPSLRNCGEWRLYFQHSGSWMRT